MFKTPSRQEIEENAKAHPVIIPDRLDLYKKEFIKFFDEATFKEICQTFNSFDNKGKQLFYLDFISQKANTEYYQDLSKEDNLYNCSICKNTLETHFLDFYNDKMGHYFHHKSKICKCNLIRKSLQLMKKNGLLKLIQKKTFDNFQVTKSFQKAMKSRAIDFVKAIIAKQNVSYFVGGQSGAGKTHICSAMLAELASNGICVYFFNYIIISCNINKSVNNLSQLITLKFKNEQNY